MAKRFLVAEARARFGELLDEADQGETVVIERRGVQYILQRDERKPAPIDFHAGWIRTS